LRVADGSFAATSNGGGMQAFPTAALEEHDRPVLRRCYPGDALRGALQLGHRREAR
jgi:hypothetical protein